MCLGLKGYVYLVINVFVSGIFFFVGYYYDLVLCMEVKSWRFEIVMFILGLFVGFGFN